MMMLPLASPPLARRLRPLLWCLLLTALAGCTVSRPLVTAQQDEGRLWTRPLDQRPLEQNLLLPQGTSSLELIAALAAPLPSESAGLLHWTLYDTTRPTPYEGDLALAGLRHNQPLTLRFPPLPETGTVRLVLTAPPELGLALWTSDDDRYTQGGLAGNDLNGGVDLLFTAERLEAPWQLPLSLRAAANRWGEAAPWLPLLLVVPGWLVAWALRAAGQRPLAAYTAGLSLALAPLVPLWTSFIGVRIYVWLAQPLFLGAALLLILFMVRDGAGLRAALRSPWQLPLFLLGAAILLSSATWLLAGRALLAPPGTSALPSAEVAQTLAADGRFDSLSAPLPSAALAATLNQITHAPLPAMLLLSALALGVALLPSLYALASEAALEPWAALWVLPLAWLWPTPWQALAGGDMATLYALVLLPLVIALGARQLGAARSPVGALLLAALPLAALILIQGWSALLAWLAALCWALWRRAHSPAIAGLRVARRAILLRAVGGLVLAALLLFPLLGFGYPTLSAAPAGYPLLAATLLVAEGARRVARRWPGTARLGAAVALLLLLPLAWWRSAPVRPSAPPVSAAEMEVMRYLSDQSQAGSVVLLNLEEGADGAWQPVDGTAWLPLYSERHTVLQSGAPPALLRRALVPGALDDPALRDELRLAGITHLILGERGGLLTPEALLGKEWARLLSHVDGAYLFQILAPTADVPTG